VLETRCCGSPNRRQTDKGGLTVSCKNQEFCPMRLAWNGRAFQRAGLCEKKHGAGSPRRVLSFEIRGFCSSTAVVFVHSVPGWP
jgi:hypothetical protein